MSFDRRRGISTPFSRRHGRGGLSLEDLNLAYTLDGNVNHINRVAFSSDGGYLSGAGNDGRVSIWSLQGSRAAHTSITGHTSDVLCTAFVGNDTLVSGGKDSMVEVHQVLPTGELRSTQRLYCHVSAVTFIEPDPSNESVFFTASIDGTIRQYDCRQPSFGCFRYQTGGPNLGSMHKSSNCIIASHNRTEKFHSVKANPVFPYQLVTASSDCVVKLYDRRRLTLLPPQAQVNKLDAWIAGYCPLHLLYQPHPTFATFAEFSPRGDSILAAYHADHVYTFDLAKPSMQTPCGELQNESRALPRPWRCRVNAALHQTTNPLAVAEIAEELTSQAHSMASLGLKVAADGLYSAALTSAQLAGGETATFAQQASIEGRAALWTSRDYPGDREAALRELERLQALQPQHLALIAKRARGFLELGSCVEAAQLIDQLRKYASNWSLLSPNHTLFEEMAWLQNEIEVLRLELEHTIRTFQHNNNGSVNSSSASRTSGEVNRGRKRKFVDPFHANDSLPFLADDRSRPLAMAAMSADDLLTAVANDSSYSSSTQQQHADMMETTTAATSTAVAVTSMQSKPTRQVHWKYFFAEGSVLLTKEVITQYSQRFIGAANINTLLLESCFLGADGECIASCSDDGHLFFWDRYSGELLLCRKADADTLLTVRAHPHSKYNGFLALATAGRDHCCRVWSAGKIFGRLPADITSTHPFTPHCGPLELDELQMLKLRSMVQQSEQQSNSDQEPQSSSEEMIDSSSSDDNNSPRDTNNQTPEQREEMEEADEGEEDMATNGSSSDDLMILPATVTRRSTQQQQRTGSSSNLQDIADAPSENIQPLSMQNLQERQRRSLLLQIDEGGRRHWNSPNNSNAASSPPPHLEKPATSSSHPSSASVRRISRASNNATATQSNKPASSHTSGSMYRDGTTTNDDSNKSSIQANNSSSTGSGLSSNQAISRRASGSGSDNSSRNDASKVPPSAMRITSPPDQQSNHESSSMTNSLSISMRSSPLGRPGRLNGLSSSNGSDTSDSIATPSDQTLLVLNEFHQELKRALAGHPMQLDEIMAVEQIVVKNQRALREHLDSYN